MIKLICNAGIHPGHRLTGSCPQPKGTTPGDAEDKSKAGAVKSQENLCHGRRGQFQMD